MVQPQEIFQHRRFRIGLAVVLTVIILSTGLAYRGFEMSRAEGTCYTTVKVCQGIPASSCIGNVEYRTDFQPRQQCSALDNITEECKTLKDAICSSEKIPDKNWQQTAETHGKSCAVWNEEYSLGLNESC